jgi:hypothetical protein
LALLANGSIGTFSSQRCYSLVNKAQAERFSQQFQVVERGKLGPGVNWDWVPGNADFRFSIVDFRFSIENCCAGA